MRKPITKAMQKLVSTIQRSHKRLQQAIELNLQYAEAYNNRGNAKFYLKQYNEAIKDYKSN